MRDRGRAGILRGGSTEYSIKPGRGFARQVVQQSQGAELFAGQRHRCRRPTAHLTRTAHRQVGVAKVDVPDCIRDAQAHCEAVDLFTGDSQRRAVGSARSQFQRAVSQHGDLTDSQLYLTGASVAASRINGAGRDRCQPRSAGSVKDQAYRQRVFTNGRRGTLVGYRDGYIGEVRIAASISVGVAHNVVAGR